MKTFNIMLDEPGLQALSFIVDAALRGAGMSAHGAASVVLAAMEQAVREASAPAPVSGNVVEMPR